MPVFNCRNRKRTRKRKELKTANSERHTRQSEKG